jgi:hypothetical protein
MNKAQHTTMYKRNAGKVFKMKDLTINKYRCKLKVKSNKIPHYAYTYR